MNLALQIAPIRRGFLAFFFTQLLTAFNDNFFKTVVLIWVAQRTPGSAFGLAPDALVALGTAVFVLPFLLFSAFAGQLADRFEKQRLIRYIKLAEIGVMVVAALGFARNDTALVVAALFAMGVHSAFFGPIKYAILPQLVAADGLVFANGLVVTSTFVAILGGALLGAVLSAQSGLLPSTGAVLAAAVLGYLVSLSVPKLAAAAPALEVRGNPFAPIPEVLRIARKTRAVFLSVLGISWFWFCGSALLLVLPGYVRTSLGGQAEVQALCLAVVCAGIAGGSLLCQRISGKNFELGLVPLGSIGMSLFMLDLFWIAPPPEPVRVLLPLAQFLEGNHALRIMGDLFGVAAFGGLHIVPLYTLIEQRAEPAERARVVAGNNFFNALLMVAASLLLAVLFQAEVPAPVMLLGLALLNAAVAVYIYSLLPEFMLRFIAWILSRVMYRLTVTGHERVPEQGGLVVVCNHISFVDFLIIAGAIRRPVRFVMDYRIAATPVVSLIFKQGKTIPIAPERENRELMERAFARIAEELRAGEVVCIFPEGKLTANGEMNPFRPGIERIIAETPVPVVPSALSGLWGSMFSRKERGWRRMLPQRFRARLSLVIGDPIPPAQVTAATLERRVKELLGTDPTFSTFAAGPIGSKKLN